MPKVGDLTVEIRGDDRNLSRATDRSLRHLDRIAEKAATLATRMKVAFAVAAAAAGAMAGSSVVAFRSVANEIDRLTKTSRQIGVPIELLSQMRFAADLSGVSVENLTKAYRNFARNAAAASAGPSDFTRALDALGVAFRKSDGSLRSAQDVMLDVADQFARMEDGAAKTAFAMKIFGELAGPRLVTLLNQGSDGIKSMMQEADKLGLTITTKTGIAAENFNDTINRLTTTFSGSFQAAVADTLPIFERLAKQLLAWVEKSGAAKVALDVLTTSLKTAASVAVILGSVFQTVGEVVSTVASAVLQVAEGEFSTAYETLKRGARDVRDINVDAFEELRLIWLGLPDAAAEAGAGVQEGLKPAVDGANEAAAAAERARVAWARFQAAFDEGARSSQTAGTQIAQALMTPEKQMETLVGAIGAGLDTIFGESKAVAIAQALINTYQGISRAIATYPPPLSTAMAAIQAAIGFAQVAKIKSTSKTSSGGTGGSASATGAGAAAGAGASTSSAHAPRQAVAITLQGDVFGREQIRGLIERINEETRDGARLVLT